MTPEEIITLFISAATTDRLLPNTAKPKAVKSMNLDYVSEETDPDAEARKTASRNDVGLWMAAMEVIKLCENEGQRRALWAWSHSKAGGMTLAKWAKKIEKIHPETASRRAKAAIAAIHHKFCSKADLHNQNDMNCVLPNDPVLEDKTDKIRSWRDYEPSDSLRCHFDDQIAVLSIHEIKASQRRARREKVIT